MDIIMLTTTVTVKADLDCYPLKMQLVMVFALVFVLKNAAGATLHFSSVSTYAVIPDRKYDVIYRGTSTIATYNRSTLTIVECAGICETASGCGGFNYCDVSGGRTCEALKANQVPIHTNKLFKDPGCFYFHKSVGQCLNGGVMANDTCLCPLGYANIFCEDYVQDCAAAYQQGYRIKHIMMIQPLLNYTEFKVECRLHEGPATRILTREQNNTDYFENRPWHSYTYGFWYPWQKNGWIGLDKLHDILSNSPYNHTAKVTVLFQNDTTEYIGYYDNFYVDSKENSYTLTYSNFWTGAFPLDDGFSGSGNDDSANGQPFCPLSSGHDCGGCSTSTSQSWWFGSGCTYVNLFAVLDELVWPKASVMLPVEKLYIDIMAIIP